MVKAKYSSEEKLRVLHKLVLDSDSFFGSKEIEKLAEKAGYKSIQAKDAVKMLLDENLVQSDKIAASSVFWMLKSQAYAQQDAELRSLRDQKRKLLEAEQRSLELYESLKTTIGEGAEERLAQVDALESRLLELEDEIRSLQSCDPRRFLQQKEEIAFARTAVERWTDNIEILRQFVRSRLGIPESQIDVLLELPQGWDTITDVSAEI